MDNFSNNNAKHKVIVNLFHNNCCLEEAFHFWKVMLKWRGYQSLENRGIVVEPIARTNSHYKRCSEQALMI